MSEHSLKIKAVAEFAVAYLQVDAEVRYWEDGTINGEEDEDGSRTPFKIGSMWRPLIDLSTGQIEDWPPGTTADVHYKVCDAGVYTLLDKDRAEVCKIDGYVPDILSPGGDGYGDYIIMKIGETGLIEDWKVILHEFEEATHD